MAACSCNALSKCYSTGSRPIATRSDGIYRKQNNITFEHYIRRKKETISTRLSYFLSASGRINLYDAFPSESLFKVAYYSFIRVQEVYTTNVQILFIFCINILITNKNPYMRQLLLQITVWEVKGARNGKTVHD